MSHWEGLWYVLGCRSTPTGRRHVHAVRRGSRRSHRRVVSSASRARMVLGPSAGEDALALLVRDRSPAPTTATVRFSIFGGRDLGTVVPVYGWPRSIDVYTVRSVHQDGRNDLKLGFRRLGDADVRRGLRRRTALERPRLTRNPADNANGPPQSKRRRPTLIRGRPGLRSEASPRGKLGLPQASKPWPVCMRFHSRLFVLYGLVQSLVPRS